MSGIDLRLAMLQAGAYIIGLLLHPDIQLKSIQSALDTHLRKLLLAPTSAPQLVYQWLWDYPVCRMVHIKESFLLMGKVLDRSADPGQN